MINQKIIKQLQLLLDKYQQIEKQLLILDIKKDHDKYLELNKEQKKLEPIINKFLIYQKNKNNLKEARQGLEIETDSELIEMFKSEIKNSELKLELAEKELNIALISKDTNDSKNVIIEIRAATGGEESSIFASDLYRMYIKYIEKQR